MAATVTGRKGSHMGRHGTGGSDDEDEWGDEGSDDSQDLRFTTDPAARWAAVPDPTAKSAFWGPDEQGAEPPGWPSPPDQVEVTGQWAPMPQREGGPAPAGPAPDARPDPFETTGAFAPPPRSKAAGRPPESSSEPASVFTRPEGPAGSFTRPEGAPGAFMRPEDSFTRPAGPPGGPGAFPEGPTETTGAFLPPEGAFNQPQQPPAGGPNRQDGPFETTGAFTRPQWDVPGLAGEPSSNETRDFNEPFGATQVFGSNEAFGPPPNDPPAPGDIKVYGAPTMVDAPTPAWADSGDNADNGFLGSGWSSDEPLDEPEPRRRRGRKKPAADPDMLAAPSSGGRGKVALLSVAAVAVVLGGTVAGVKFMSSSDDPAKCAGATCAAVQVSNQPGPKVTESAPEEEPTEEPSDEPTEKESKPADTPKPSATVNVHTPRRSASPTPTPKPTKTKTKDPVRPTREPVASPTESLTEPTEESTTITDPNTGAPVDPQSTVTSNPAGGQSVSLNFDVVNQGLVGYTAHLDVVNASAEALPSLTVSLPIRGRVLDVTGAGWTQDGDQLIIDLSESLDTGGSTQLTISATGRGAAPVNCGLVGGECAVN
ncbi:hypothetical protein [Nonomuraea sp. NPDC049141]|uniref:hypothetical protein n=1 Tax=Nonomuraea sp. NPDC049141 TaxID=3155500 RepID=UPI0033D42442